MQTYLKNDKKDHYFLINEPYKSFKHIMMIRGWVRSICEARVHTSLYIRIYEKTNIIYIFPRNDFVNIKYASHIWKCWIIHIWTSIMYTYRHIIIWKCELYTQAQAQYIHTGTVFIMWSYENVNYTHKLIKYPNHRFTRCTHYGMF